MKHLDQAFAWILLVLGIIHCVVTPLVSSGFKLGAVWFFGTGTAVVFAGLLNLIRIHHRSGLVWLRGAYVATNALTFLVAVAATWGMRAELLSNPQVPILLISSFGEILFSTRRA